MVLVRGMLDWKWTMLLIMLKEDIVLHGQILLAILVK